MIGVLLAARTAAADSWQNGDHLTGEWGGERTKLADHGVTIDLVYSTEAFTNFSSGRLLGHVDAALTVDTEKLGLWDGGSFYALGQNDHGSGVDELVGSITSVSNLAAEPFTQLTELFYQQSLAGDVFQIRVGKQDANRDWGTPRYGGNFLNNNFGMFPNTPLPSYPTTGLGAALTVRPVPWLATRLGLYEGSPAIGGLGLDTAFRDGAGYTAITGAAATRHWGPKGRDDGTTSIGLWHGSGSFAEVGMRDMARTFSTDDGFLVQDDEHIFLHPTNPDDPRGLTISLRFSWARPDRTTISRYAGGSAAWYGIGARHDDSVGLGFGYLALGESLDGTATRPTDEWFVDGSYKLRLTKFISLQPDVEIYRHPGGTGDDAWIVGARLKLKL